MAFANRNERAKIFENTVKICTAGRFKDLFPDESNHYKNNDNRFNSVKIEKKFNTKIEVINHDVLVVAEALHTSGEDHILVLNLASYQHFLGGVESGAMAQEEELGRRTNYFKAGDKHYPFNKMEGIYTSNVTIIKNSNYCVIENPFNVSMLAVAGIKNPKLVNNKLTGADYNTTHKTIDNMFKIALLNNHSVLVLGALGCGAYGNPAEEIIKIYNDCLKKYDGCFKRIIFAVLSKNDNNFDMFNTLINV